MYKEKGMLSNEGQIIYDILCGITGDSEVYKIVDADEITEKLPSDSAFTKVQLSQIIRELKDMDYVDIKYFTPDEYCLRVIKRIVEAQKNSSDNIIEEKPIEVVETKKRELYGKKRSGGVVRPGLVLFMSFLGGIIGSGFVAAVTAILLKFVI